MSKNNPLPFVKMQSAGNDFVFIDGRRERHALTPRKARQILHRQVGIGADQLLLLKKSTRPDAQHFLRIFNPDGSEAEMCGNGVLCAAQLLHRQTPGKRSPITFQTRVGLIRASSPPIEVDMGEPVLEASRIPVRASGFVMGKLLSIAGKTFKIYCVSMGNPHCVIFVDDPDRFPVEKYGPLIETHPFFPRRTNVEFVGKIRSHRVKVRVWERGAGLTLSCGTGACAALVAGALTRRFPRAGQLQFPGGVLAARWASDNHLYLSSRSMSVVFQGRFNHV